MIFNVFWKSSNRRLKYPPVSPSGGEKLLEMPKYYRWTTMASLAIETAWHKDGICWGQLIKAIWTYWTGLFQNLSLLCEVLSSGKMKGQRSSDQNYVFGYPCECLGNIFPKDKEVVSHSHFLRRQNTSLGPLEAKYTYQCGGKRCDQRHTVAAVENAMFLNSILLKFITILHTNYSPYFHNSIGSFPITML